MVYLVASWKSFPRSTFFHRNSTVLCIEPMLYMLHFVQSIGTWVVLPGFECDQQTQGSDRNDTQCSCNTSDLVLLSVQILQVDIMRGFFAVKLGQIRLVRLGQVKLGWVSLVWLGSVRFFYGELSLGEKSDGEKSQSRLIQ